MSIYARYFDRETLVHTLDELIDFLSSIPEIAVTSRMVSDIQAYLESTLPYPKRYKVRPRVYFILIKTNAQTLEEFHANNQKRDDSGEDVAQEDPRDQKQQELARLLPGWYHCSMTFKRVIQIPETPKFQYQDTEFVAFIKGSNALECYDRAIEYLQSRQDIDPRSQFPGPRHASYVFRYVGEELTEAQMEEAELQPETEQEAQAE